MIGSEMIQSLKLFVQILREDIAFLQLDMNKEVCSLIAVSHLLSMWKAYLRMELTNGEGRAKGITEKWIHIPDHTGPEVFPAYGLVS